MADLDDLVRATTAPQQQVRRRLLELIAAIWGELPEVRDAQLAGWLARVVPFAEGAQAQIAAMTDAGLASLIAAETGERVRPVGVAPASVTTEALRGVPAGELWGRPFVTTWTALAGGAEPAQALAQGLRRAQDLAATNLQLARTHTVRRVLSRDKRVVGYRRVLTGSVSCGLCVVASTQRYHKADLLPVHPGCDCAVRPLVGGSDPGQVIDVDRLEAVHGSVRDRLGVASDDARSAADYRRLIVTHEHGEIGPVLAVRGQKFTGPADF